MLQCAFLGAFVVAFVGAVSSACWCGSVRMGAYRYVKEKGETAESERRGEREKWKDCFEMWGTFPLAFFADLLQKTRCGTQ